jgi:hypothetical protein
VTQADISTMLERLGRIEERLGGMEGKMESELSAGKQRGSDQGRIGERVATLEANMTHVLATLNSLGFRSSMAATGGLTSAGGILWLLFGGG